MELDSKQKLLLAIYTEYQKDLPDMDQITYTNLGMDINVFKVAVDKIMNEGFITDASVVHGGNGTVPLHVRLTYCKMTRYGIEYVEQKMGIDSLLSGEQKVKNVMEKTAKWGWDQFKDFGARVLAEMLK